MLEILLIWVVFGLVNIFWGQKFCQYISQKWIKEYEPSIWISFWVGFPVLTFVLGGFSFFFNLGPVLKAVIWLILLLPICFSVSWLQQFIIQIKNGFSSLGFPGLTIGILGFVISLLKSSGFPEIFDEGAYHLPLIRMWETQGLVPGIANLNGHYGLNSSWHILTAFSNFSFLPGWKLAIALNGLLALALSIYAGVSLNKILKNRGLASDWIVIFLPVFVFRNLLSSPSTDIPAIICSWFIFTIWFKNIEQRESPWKIWPMLFILPFWVVMIKASSAALILIPIGLFLLAYKEGFKSRLILIVVFGVCLLLPWIIQNWLLTGYGIFPIRSTALFNPEWQVPLSSIDKKFYLEQFGAFAPPQHFTWSWFTTWFKAHNKDTQVILLLDLSAMVSVLIPLFRKDEERIWTKVYLFATLFACILIWLVTITEPRYGFGALVFSALFPIAIIIKKITDRFSALRFFALVILAIQFFNCLKTWKEAEFTVNQIMFPIERPEVEFKPVLCGNFVAQSPVNYSVVRPINKPVFCWDCPFPCVPKEGLSDSSSIYKIQVLNRFGFSFRNSN